MDRSGGQLPQTHTPSSHAGSPPHAQWSGTAGHVVVPQPAKRRPMETTIARILSGYQLAQAES
jgi:hypothetical protein